MKSKNGETTLADVVKSVHDLTRRVDGVNESVHEVTHSVHELAKAMNAGFAKLTHEVVDLRGEVVVLGKKFDRLELRFERSLLTAGSRGLDHEARIARLEDEVEALKSL